MYPDEMTIEEETEVAEEILALTRIANGYTEVVTDMRAWLITEKRRIWTEERAELSAELHALDPINVEGDSARFDLIWEQLREVETSLKSLPA